MDLSLSLGLKGSTSTENEEEERRNSRSGPEIEAPSPPPVSVDEIGDDEENARAEEIGRVEADNEALMKRIQEANLEFEAVYDRVKSPNTKGGRGQDKSVRRLEVVMKENETLHDTLARTYKSISILQHLSVTEDNVPDQVKAKKFKKREDVSDNGNKKKTKTDQEASDDNKETSLLQLVAMEELVPEQLMSESKVVNKKKKKKEEDVFDTSNKRRVVPMDFQDPQDGIKWGPAGRDPSLKDGLIKTLYKKCLMNPDCPARKHLKIVRGTLVAVDYVDEDRHNHPLPPSS